MGEILMYVTPSHWILKNCIIFTNKLMFLNKKGFTHSPHSEFKRVFPLPTEISLVESISLMIFQKLTGFLRFQGINLGKGIITIKEV